jgi:hypothetical protein
LTKVCWGESSGKRASHSTSEKVPFDLLPAGQVFTVTPPPPAFRDDVILGWHAQAVAVAAMGDHPCLAPRVSRHSALGTLDTFDVRGLPDGFPPPPLRSGARFTQNGPFHRRAKIYSAGFAVRNRPGQILVTAFTEIQLPRRHLLHRQRANLVEEQTHHALVVLQRIRLRGFHFSED